jgi:hypothetical protein
LAFTGSRRCADETKDDKGPKSSRNISPWPYRGVGVAQPFTSLADSSSAQFFLLERRWGSKERSRYSDGIAAKL